MSFKLGLVGLCTSHPEAWLPIIRRLTAERKIDVEVVAAWDSGETRPRGFASEFCDKNNVVRPVENLAEMVPLVDGVIVHTTNWDRHLEHAEPFLSVGKSVLIDKPFAGNLRDLNRFVDLIKSGSRICGGSSIRFSPELAELQAKPMEERGELHTAYTVLGMDDYNYGIHGYALLCGLFGGHLNSVRYLGDNGKKQLMLTWKSGKVAFYTMGRGPWLPSKVTVVSDKAVFNLEMTRFYETFLEKNLPYMVGQTNVMPIPVDELMAPELAALAARQSWMNHGQEIFLDDLRLDDPGYDGTAFAVEYRRARLPFAGGQ